MQPIYPTYIAEKWGIGLESARRTFYCTTQRGLWTLLHPSLSRNFQMNYQQLRYRRLRHDFFGDTLLAGTKSKSGNKYAKVFVTKFGWSRAFPLDKNGDAHDSLSMLFQRYGVPTKIIVESSKEQTLGDFKRKVSEASFHLKQTELEYTWKMVSEVGIRELKRVSGRKMTKMKAPKVLWGDCLELES